MDSVNAQLQRSPQQPDFYAQFFSGRSVETTEIAARSQAQKDITIYTDEGDKVTLAFESEDELLYANIQGHAYQAQKVGMQNAAAVQLQSVMVAQQSIALEREQSFTVTVEGDLSDQELEDIKTALQKIDSLMTDILYAGDFSEAAETTSELRGLESLAGIEATYQYATDIAVQQTEVQENALAASKESPAFHRRGHGHRRMPASRFVDDLVKIIKDAGIKPRMFLRPLKGLFKDYSGHSGHAKHAGKPHFDWVRDVQKDLFDKIESND